MTERATVHEGDCLDVLPKLEPRAHFAYIDPPFNTGRRKTGRSGAFADRWTDTAAWLEFLRPRLAAVAAAMHAQGLVLVHCDWRTSHHVRLALDVLFGADAFVNHLVWSYGLGGSSPRRFARKHDDLLLYASGPDYWFEAPRVPATSARMRGETKKATDVLDIPALNNMARERTGYPTQKPLALLDLLIRACSPPGGTVLDPCCGSGTTLVAAVAAGRHAIGIDVNPDAVALSRRRLEAAAHQPA